METRIKMAATQRQMNYLLSHYGVKLCERMDKEEPKFPIPGEANVYLWKVLLRHPEGLSIPSLIGYSKLLPMLRNSYKNRKYDNADSYHIRVVAPEYVKFKRKVHE